MQYIRKSDSRGAVDLGWLQSKHSFSFGSYYDPQHMGVSVLKVINDDIVKPDQGFGTHGHRDMEIISYVIDGELAHKDSMGHTYTVTAGEVQRMSAGSGVRHSEFNASSTQNVNFLQIWIQPNVLGIKPSYEQKRIEQQGALTPLVTPNGVNDSLSIHQDASVFRLKLSAGESYTLNTQNRIGYLHLIKGNIVIDEQHFSDGDAFALNINEQVEVTATSNDPIEALWFDLPTMSNAS